MPENEGTEWYVSVCGLNCAKCEIRRAYKSGDREQQGRIAKDIFGEKSDVKPENITCDGCRGELGVHWSPDCKMLSCAKDRKHTYCFECKDFVCTKLEAFASDGASNHRRTVENLKRMKEKGLENWKAEQEKRDNCVFCP